MTDITEILFVSGITDGTPLTGRVAFDKVGDAVLSALAMAPLGPGEAGLAETCLADLTRKFGGANKGNIPILLGQAASFATANAPFAEAA